MGNQLADLCTSDSNKVVGFDNGMEIIVKQPIISIPQRSKIVQQIYQQLIRDKSVDYTLQQQKSSFTPIKLNIFEQDGIYLGWIRNDKPHGPGQLYFNNKSYLQAIFKQGEVYCEDGLFIEKVTLRIPNKMLKTGGDVVKAQFQNGLLEGKGEKYFEDGRIYKGQFKKGIMQGKGTLLYNNNQIYQGYFRENEPNGIGRYKTQNYQYFGPFENNLKSGKGTIIFKDSSKFEGWLVNNKIDGYGEWHRPNGQIQKGDYNIQLPI